MTRGATLAEIVATLTIIGLAAGWAVPYLAAPLDRLEVDNAAYAIATAHTRARMIAILESRYVLLRIDADSMRISLVADGDTIRRWSARGPAWNGVTLTGPSHPMIFTPVGITAGVSNGTYTVRRGDASRSVIISRLGRVRMRP